MRQIEYQIILRPSVEYVEQCGKFMIDTKAMAEFLGLAPKTVTQLVYTDRVPLPCRLGARNFYRWSVLELLEWVEAGCPRRTQWIRIRGSSGWCPSWRW